MNGPFPHEPVPEPEALLGPLPARRVVKKAVILAAGRGRRMGKLTADRPKAALEVGGHAMIDWQIAALRAAGVEKIAIVTGHGAAALAGRDVSYIHNPNWASGTQVETLLCARDWISDEPVIVSYGDILYHPCAPLALLERPGDIVIAYDADHRWLWKKRFGDWLKDSETFVLGPGQVLTEIGGKPNDIEAIDGQFMGLMLFTSRGLELMTRRFQIAGDIARKGLDFTRLLSGMADAGERIDTAANVLSWMEVDGVKDLRIAQRMAERDEIKGSGPHLTFPTDLITGPIESPSKAPDEAIDADSGAPSFSTVKAANDTIIGGPASEVWDEARLSPYAAIRDYRVTNTFAVQNWGRSGSTFVQSLFDDHPQVLSTPNFYSRRYYLAWANSIVTAPDDKKIDAFLRAFQQWWDTGLVDATAGLHRLGPERRELAGVKREVLEGYLRAAFAKGGAITRRTLFEAAHLAYALARNQTLADGGLQILYPIHGEPRGVACALLEDFPGARFIHTIRDPASNTASSIQHYCFNDLDLRADALESALTGLFEGRSARYGRQHTAFDTRPYLGYLAKSGCARLLKLEDLHQDGSALMNSACRWLHLDSDERLVTSTWDGKLWWNRPESGRDSRLGGQVANRNVAHRLGRGDRRKIEMLLRGAPELQAAYGLEASAARHGVIARLLAAASPWRQEGLPRRTELRSLRALLAISPILPATLVQRLEGAIKRERYRVGLLEMAVGAVGVRKKLQDSQKAGAVHAALLVTPTKQGGWHTRALAASHTEKLGGPDRLALIFLDEAMMDRNISTHVFWLTILILGWPICQIKTFLRIRLLMFRLLTTRYRYDVTKQLSPM